MRDRRSVPSREHHHPENNCQYCHPDTSTDAWTSFDDDKLCGDDFEQRCCDGVCCEALACCNEDRVCEEFGSLVCADCRIDRAGYLDGDPNPDVDCQICDPSRSDSAWSEADDDSVLRRERQPGLLRRGLLPGGGVLHPAGDLRTVRMLDRSRCRGIRASQTSACDVCCGGLCCSPDECCGDDDLCGPCAAGCVIGGVHYGDGQSATRNVFCQVCNPDFPTEWSPRAHPDCPPVCGNEVCEPEGCTINGVDYPNLALNPENECQQCDSAESTTDWSPNGFASCGPTGEQFCSGGGVCCDLGVCPDLSALVCGDYCDDLCAIGGVLYHHGDHNPANDCQACNNNLNPTAWSPVCSDACCAPLFCVHDGGSHCGPRDD